VSARGDWRSAPLTTDRAFFGNELHDLQFGQGIPASRTKCTPPSKSLCEL